MLRRRFPNIWILMILDFFLSRNYKCRRGIWFVAAMCLRDIHILHILSTATC